MSFYKQMYITSKCTTDTNVNRKQQYICCGRKFFMECYYLHFYIFRFNTLIMNYTSML
jgi:hypothetical protein